MKLRDIADAAGVSLTTVSLVLNGKVGVSPEKREQIKSLLLENNYHIRSPQGSDSSNNNIRFLKYSKHSYLVNGNPGFVTQIMDAVEKECRKHNYNLLITAFDDFRSINLEELLGNPATKGVILLGTEIANEDMAVFSKIGKPMVVVDNGLPQLPFSTVTMNNKDAIFIAIQHLLELGHRHIGFLYNSLPSNNDLERRQAFEDALRFYGHPFEPELVFSIFPTMDGARQSVAELLQKNMRFPTALVANNDSIAIGAIRALQDGGLNIPRDISVTGFDGLPFSTMAEPPLTTVNVPCSDIGYWAVRILHERIKGRSTSHCKMLVGTSFAVRGSTDAYHSPRVHPNLLEE